MDHATTAGRTELLARATWRKSRYSNPNGECVQTAHLASGDVAVRDSRLPDGPALIFTRVQWEAFLRRVQVGDLG